MSPESVVSASFAGVVVRNAKFVQAAPTQRSISNSSSLSELSFQTRSMALEDVAVALRADGAVGGLGGSPPPGVVAQSVLEKPDRDRRVLPFLFVVSVYTRTL